MVAYRARLDDVLLVKGKKVEASETIRVKIPGIVAPDGRTQRTDLDVSTDGKAEWDKMYQKFLNDIQVAAEPLWAVLNARSENAGPAPGRRRSRQAESSDEATAETPPASTNGEEPA